jgi:hypothetical protein
LRGRGAGWSLESSFMGRIYALARGIASRVGLRGEAVRNTFLRMMSGR